MTLGLYFLPHIILLLVLDSGSLYITCLHSLTLWPSLHSVTLGLYLLPLTSHHSLLDLWLKVSISYISSFTSWFDSVSLSLTSHIQLLVFDSGFLLHLIILQLFVWLWISISYFSSFISSFLTLDLSCTSHHSLLVLWPWVSISFFSSVSSWFCDSGLYLLLLIISSWFLVSESQSLTSYSTPPGYMTLGLISYLSSISSCSVNPLSLTSHHSPPGSELWVSISYLWSVSCWFCDPGSLCLTFHASTWFDDAGSPSLTSQFYSWLFESGSLSLTLINFLLALGLRVSISYLSSFASCLCDSGLILLPIINLLLALSLWLSISYQSCPPPSSVTWITISYLSSLFCLFDSWPQSLTSHHLSPGCLTLGLYLLPLINLLLALWLWALSLTSHHLPPGYSTLGLHFLPLIIHLMVLWLWVFISFF